MRNKSLQIVFFWLIILLWTTSLQAQYLKQWQKSFKDVPEISKVAVTTNGDAIFAANINDAYTAKVWLAKVNEHGTKMWTKTIEAKANDVVAALAVTKNNNIVLVISQNEKHSLLLMLNENGQELWQKQLKFTETYAVSLTENDAIIIGGTVRKYDADFWLAKINLKGEVLWNQVFDANSNEVVQAVVATPNGGCVAVGDSKGITWMFELDENGNTLWKEEIKETGLKMYASDITAANNTLLTVGYSTVPGLVQRDDIWLMLTNKQGKVVWKKHLGDEAFNEFAYATDKTTEGNFVAVGVVDYPLNQRLDACVLVLDDQGKRVWRKIFDQAYKSEALDVAATPNGGFVVVGNRSTAQVNSKSYSWAVRYEPEKKIPEKPKDTKNPEITLLQPALNHDTLYAKANTVYLKGFVQDDSPLKSIVIGKHKVKIPVEATSKKNAFECSLALIGQNSITIEAVDVYGNTMLKNIPIVYPKPAHDNESPKIVITHPTVNRLAKLVVKQATIEVRGYATDDSGVQNIRVGGYKADLDNVNQKTTNFKALLSLSQGQQTFWVEATDKKGNVGKQDFTLHYEPNDKIKVPEQSNNSDEQNEAYLLVVGVSDYDHWNDLPNAVKDAKQLKEVLTTKYQFGATNTITLLNEEATAENIRKAFRQLALQVKPTDNVLVYFSGHGAYDEVFKEGYWVPVDAPKDNKNKYMSNSDILTQVRAINSKHTFLIADACFSGALFAEKKGFVANVDQYQSRWGLSSGRLEAVSDGVPGTNSPFADALLTYLNTNQKAAFAASELVQYVKVTVANNSEQTPIGNPLRNVGDKGGEFVFKRKVE